MSSTHTKHYFLFKVTYYYIYIIYYIRLYTKLSYRSIYILYLYTCVYLYVYGCLCAPICHMWWMSVCAYMSYVMDVERRQNFWSIISNKKTACNVRDFVFPFNLFSLAFGVLKCTLSSTAAEGTDKLLIEEWQYIIMRYDAHGKYKLQFSFIFVHGLTFSYGFTIPHHCLYVSNS